MDQPKFDVVIVGAGAAGLMAALEIALTGRAVTVVEAKNRCGGRINSIYQENKEAVELGAEFVHGDLPLTLSLFEKAGIKKREVEGTVWRYKDGRLAKQEDFIEDYNQLEKLFRELKTDMPVSEFINNYLNDKNLEELKFSLQNYVEGYYAADAQKASTFALCKELSTDEGKNYRVDRSYQQLINYLNDQCLSKGVQFYFDEEVQEISWKPLTVRVRTNKQTIVGNKTIITVSIGVLQSGNIRFMPALTEKMTAIKQLGYGFVAKIILCFTEPFWKDEAFTSQKKLIQLSFLFSGQPIPTWWTQHPKESTVLTGWLAGPSAERTGKMTTEEITKEAIESLATIFSADPSVIAKKLQQAHWYNWITDEHFKGAYSYAVLNGESLIKTIKEPVENTLYFAGEGLVPGNEIGTVEAALCSGRDMAQRVIAGFSLR